MPLPKPAVLALKTWRSVFGEGSKVEVWARARYLGAVRNEVRRDAGPGWVQYTTSRSVVVSESDDFPEPRRGIVLRGGCDMPSAFTAAPLIAERIRGTVAISRQIGGTGGHRSDQILQTLDDLDRDAVAETREKLKLNSHYFTPTFFDRTFSVSNLPQAGEFPKDVIVLGIASDQVRQVYRHRKHGFVVDPGGWWLNQDLNNVLGDLSVVEWFRDNFRRAGRMSLDDFRKNNARLVAETRERVGAHIVYYNTMVVDPANPTHNYQLVKAAHSVRRREFAIALTELSRDLGFPIVDVDRVLKTAGVEQQVDFAHFPTDRMMPIGAELHRILRQLGTV